jgi:hypothetical protein
MSKHPCPRTGIALAVLAVTICLGACEGRQKGEQPATVGNDQPAAVTSRADASPIVESARQDLARRLDRSVEDVKLLEDRPVYWRSSALGCPEPGKSYTQVLTRGWLIRLTVGRAEYRYHSGQDGPTFTCSPAQAESPVPYAED